MKTLRPASKMFQNLMAIKGSFDYGKKSLDWSTKVYEGRFSACDKKANPGLETMAPGSNSSYRYLRPLNSY